jgi:hypothetical protein
VNARFNSHGKFHALRSGIGLLIVLARQVFNAEGKIRGGMFPRAGGNFGLYKNAIALRLGKNKPNRFRKALIVKALDIVAVKNTQRGKIGERGKLLSLKVRQIGFEPPRFQIKTVSLFDKHPLDGHVLLSRKTPGLTIAAAADTMG